MQDLYHQHCNQNKEPPKIVLVTITAPISTVGIPTQHCGLGVQDLGLRVYGLGLRGFRA